MPTTVPSFATNPVTLVFQHIDRRADSTAKWTVQPFFAHWPSLLLPLDQLKIDQAFVRDILVDASSRAVAQTITALSKALGLTVIAEGVETEAQREALARLDCHSFQGYLFSRPVPLDKFELLRSSRAKSATQT